MGTRLDLQRVLESIMRDEVGDSYYRVFYQAPGTEKLKYPCIIYERSRIETIHANNMPYRLRTRYSVTLITKDPEDNLVKRLAELPCCTHNRHFTKDNLHHDLYDLYF